MGIENNLLRKLFENVYFLNGTAYAGKSTMVRLLAEKYEGICCGENYHDELMYLIDPEYQPNLSYFKTMSGWQEFISRTPEEYDAWYIGTGQEAAELEIIKLLQLCSTGKKIFVDTNISVNTLQEISDYNHVAIMLSPQRMSVDRFFDRPDADKQFIYRKIMEAPDPDRAMFNYRNCLERINSQEHYEEFANSGFFTHLRTEESTIEDTLEQLEKHFLLI
ncbi:MAG: hypothetical protein IJ001_09955 [Oscillospiraceae bacterium]|nr:hypothetical protein [Oscillospiraceae bacterium]